MAGFTLRQGDADTFEEHPFEVARRALLVAAELEEEQNTGWAALCARFANALPTDRDRTVLRAAVESDDKARDRDEWLAERSALENERQAVWKGMSASARESLVLQVLGDERLSIPALVPRLNAALGYPPEKYSVVVYQHQVRTLVKRMFDAGQLQREPGAVGKGTAHRYSRNRTLEGAILELERTYQEGGE
jgi:hypothetical protein